MIEPWREVAQDHPVEEIDERPAKHALPGRRANMITESGQSKCKRCGRWFQPKEPDQKYGPVCARKMAGQRVIQDGIIEVRDAKGEITAVII